ncbi:MAG: serine/threonine protein kinase [Candidatus Aureabacteria bacterium]|nr:serine/threonine protein kinase [Candidatus Auribacterota bacterium]
MLWGIGIVLFIVLGVIGFYFHKKRPPSSGSPASAHKADPSAPASENASVSFSADSPVKNLHDLTKRIAEILGEKYTHFFPLDTGGMGFLVSAMEKETKRKVVIKTILPDLNRDQRALKLFFDESSAINKMNHPNIVKILDVGQTKELYYYIMEYLEGETLQNKIDREKKISVSEVVKIGTQIARALQHCHDNYIVHRDIKPSNIFLCASGTAKIIDFGIVKVISGDPALLAGTTKIGSPDFASPEQLQGKAISGKSDVYSLGTCLFYMLSGRMPYKASDMLAKLLEKPKDLHEFCPDLSKELVSIIHGSIELDPAQRITSMELWKRLRNIKG